MRDFSYKERRTITGKTRYAVDLDDETSARLQEIKRACNMTTQEILENFIKYALREVEQKVDETKQQA